MMNGDHLVTIMVLVLVVIEVFIPPAEGLLRQLYQGDDHHNNRIILKVVVHLMVVVVGVKVVVAHLQNRIMVTIEVKVVVAHHHFHDGMITMDNIRTTTNNDIIIILVLLHVIHPLLLDRIHRPTNNDDGET
jgi:hypothetical protein